jgi:hypothetical protein
LPWDLSAFEIEAFFNFSDAERCYRRSAWIGTWRIYPMSLYGAMPAGWRPAPRRSPTR